MLEGSATLRFLGWAAYSPSSKIRARVWSFDETDVIDGAFIATRVAESAARRRSLAARTDACRLVFSESDGLPGVIADRYGPFVVLELTSVGADRWRGELTAAFAALDGVAGVFERSDVEVRDRESLERRTGLLHGEDPPEHVEITEDGLRYAVDLRAGHKTGFYLDQRESRLALARLVDGRRVLNVFAFTGAFGVVASSHGATEVTQVDSSAPALALAARNLEINGCAPSAMTVADAFSELRRLRAAGQRFDLIVLDPPKLAHHTKGLDRATRAYKDANLVAAQLLNPGGVLVTFSCSGLVSEDLFQKVVAGAMLDARRDARIVGRLHQASDHPVHLAVPETAYLKGLVCELS